MNKTVEKIENYKNREIVKAMEKAKKGYDEAEDSYRDSGYDRYFKKMEKYEKEIEELEEYLHGTKSKGEEISVDQYKEYKEMKEDLKNLASKFFYMFKDFNLPDTPEIQGIQRILDKYKY